jgi:hypothetical protein
VRLYSLESSRPEKTVWVAGRDRLFPGAENGRDSAPQKGVFWKIVVGFILAYEPGPLHRQSSPAEDPAGSPKR